jgi:hypothetical protein
MDLGNILHFDRRDAFLEGPAGKPPPGITPNLLHPPNRTDIAYGTATTAAVVCALLVFVRLYTRVRYRKKIVIEDGPFPVLIHCRVHRAKQF